MISNDIKEVLISSSQIEEVCKKLGQQIKNDYKDKQLIIIGLLKGCLPFMSDIIKNIDDYVLIDYMDVSSYSGKESTGKVKILKDIEIDVTNKDVIIIDDIVDTGTTLSNIINLFKERNVKSVEACCLLNKPLNRTCDVNVKYFGFDIPNEFVVGYGLDYNELYRNLPYIATLKECIYKK